jgi:ribose transport system substrate-binding protein
MWKSFASFAAAGLTAAALASSALAQDKVVIGHSQPNLGWPYIAAFTKALEAEVANNPNVEVVTLSADGDIAKQSTDISTLINRKVDVLLVTSLDGSAVIPSLKAAHDAGIPVLAVSNEPAPEGQQFISGYSGPDDYQQGVIAGELLNEALDGKGGVAIIEGSPGQSTTIARTDGFKKALADAGSEITVLGAQTADWNPVKAKDVAQAFLTAYGDELKGLFSQDDNTAAAAAEVFKEAGRPDIRVVGTGGTMNGLKAIREGGMYGTMDQSPTTDAQQALKFALMLAKGEPLPEKRNIIPMPKITAANADQFKGEW